ncbi:MAG TPA: SAM-dependent methyltransferase [Rhizobiaceae bacterium]|nr:SAM-dependent methyltransferase [Rhizobiaceae bacterium]
MTDKPTPETLRAGEVALELPDRFDAGLYFIGRIETPWATREECPRRGDPEDGPDCRLIVDERFAAALAGIESRDELLVLYFMDEARRDLAIQNPRHRGHAIGTFALRSPVRPNPVAASRVRLLSHSRNVLVVRGLDCRSGTPLVDIKPEFAPAARNCDEAE